MQRVKFRSEWIATVVTEPAVYRAVQLARLSRCPQDCTESPESPPNGRGGGLGPDQNGMGPLSASLRASSVDVKSLRRRPQQLLHN